MRNRPSQVRVATAVLDDCASSAQNLWNAQIAAIALGIMALLLPACTENQPEATAPQVGADLEDVEEETGQYLGQTVTVNGEISNVVSPRAFIIQEDNIFGDEGLLVVSANPIADLNEDTAVQVTGNVRQITTTEIEREFNLGPASEYEVYIEDRPAIVAQTTQVVNQ